MDDMCPSCAGWIYGSPTAETMSPDTWCTCSLTSNPVNIPMEDSEYEEEVI
jgi:hypothetical protein